VLVVVLPTCFWRFRTVRSLALLGADGSWMSVENTS